MKNKLSDKELLKLMRKSHASNEGDSGWLGALIILFLAVLAFLYENAGR